jgi:hypothetical protein
MLLSKPKTERKKSCWALVEKVLVDIPHSLVVERFFLQFVCVIRKTSLQVGIVLIKIHIFSVLAIHPVFFYLKKSFFLRNAWILLTKDEDIHGIPSVPLIRWARALPHSAPGSLWPTFVSARLVSLTVRQACTITLFSWFPTSLSLPSHISVTL